MVAAGDAQLLQQRIELAAEELDRPELGRRVGEVLRAPAPDLVVEHARPRCDPCELGQRLGVVMRSARPAVE
jgi:hypothetical protein